MKKKWKKKVVKFKQLSKYKYILRCFYVKNYY